MTTRRTFIKLSTGGCLESVAVPLHAFRSLNIGIGAYSYHSLSLDDMIVQLNALRVREIARSRVEFMLLSHPQDQLFSTAKEKLDRAGIRCVSYYAATFKSSQDIDDAVRFAKLLGVNNITGDATEEDILKQIDTRLTQEELTFGGNRC